MTQETKEKQATITGHEKLPESDTAPAVQEEPHDVWKYIMLLGVVCLTMLGGSIVMCFGIIFSDYLISLNTSSVMTTWILNCLMFNFFIVAPISVEMSRQYSHRLVALVGVTSFVAGILISAFAPNAEFLFFSISILAGIGGGLAYAVAVCIVPIFFVKMRGLACGIMIAGFTLGQIALPPVITKFMVYFGYTGSLLLFCAISMHGLPAALLLHPVKWHLPGGIWLRNAKREKKSDTENPPSTKGNRKIKDKNSGEPNEAYEPESVVYVRTKNLANISEENVVVTSADAISSFCSTTNKRLEVVHDEEAENEDDCPASVVSEKSNKKKKKKGFLNIIKSVIIAIPASLKEINSLKLGILAMVTSTNSVFFVNFAALMPFAVKDRGYNSEDAALLMSIFGIANLSFRVTASLLSDLPNFRPDYVFLCGTLTMAVSGLGFALSDNILVLRVSIAGVGAGSGTVVSLWMIVIIYFVGMKRNAKFFAANCVLLSFLYIIIGPLIGLLRDLSGSYYICMAITSAIPFTSFFTWIFLPRIVNFVKKVIQDKTAIEPVTNAQSEGA